MDSENVKDRKFYPSFEEFDAACAITELTIDQQNALLDFFSEGDEKKRSMILVLLQTGTSETDVSAFEGIKEF